MPQLFAVMACGSGWLKSEVAGIGGRVTVPVNLPAVISVHIDRFQIVSRGIGCKLIHRFWLAYPQQSPLHLTAKQLQKILSAGQHGLAFAFIMSVTEVKGEEQTGFQHGIALRVSDR